MYEKFLHYFCLFLLNDKSKKIVFDSILDGEIMENEEELKGKFSNIFIMILFGIMMNDLENVKHFLSNSVYNKFKKIVDANILNNETQMYDELNVKSIKILSIEEEDNYNVVKVKIVSRYMDYVIDSNTKKYKRGVNTHRIEKDNILTFKKLKNASLRKSVIKCESCGANMDINFSGKCEYCGSIADVTSYDFVLTDIITN